MKKELYIIRHAKSSWSEPNLSDFDRPLNKRGKHDAPMMGKILRSKNILPDVIYSSTANRANTTARLIVEQLKNSIEIVDKPEFYHASEVSLINEINKFSTKANCAFMFGHNPGFTYLAERLTDTNFGNIPTCGIVGIRFEYDSWDLIGKNSGEVIFYDYPKNHY